MKKQIVLSLATLIAFAAPVAKADGDYCREYTKNVNIGGRIQQAYGTACQLPDGTWKIMSEDGQYTNENINIIDDQPRGNTYVTNSYYYDDDEYYYPRPRSTSLLTFSFGNFGLWRNGLWCPRNNYSHNYGWNRHRWGHKDFAYNNNNGWRGGRGGRGSSNDGHHGRSRH